MGQGSRGGNSGVSSSGVRQREDKEAKKAAEKPVVISNRNDNRNSAQSNNRGGGRGFGRGFGRGLGIFRGLGALGRGLGNLGQGTGGGSGFGGSGFGSTTPPPGPTQQNKIPTIKRVKPTKVKLTKQRKNKIPN